MTISNGYGINKNRIIISLGDPAGIGPEVILKALGAIDSSIEAEPLIVGCKETMEIIYSKLKSQGIKAIANPKNLTIKDIPYQEKICPGKSSKAAGKASFDWLTVATKLMLKGHGRALITGPVAKHSWKEAGHSYPGQTERLAELAEAKTTSMLFSAQSPYNGWRLNTLLATTHIPLIQIHKELTPNLLTEKLNFLLEFCQKFTKEPKLLIAGLNPHAGEKGQLGKEEIEWIIPTLKEWKNKNPRISLKGPISPDTCWISAAKSWKKNVPAKNLPDGILALYHDQGLIPIKLIAFESAVNTTLGLPFIRTSPDHGTGFDIAGEGIACFESMLSAIKLALELTEKNN